MRNLTILTSRVYIVYQTLFILLDFHPVPHNFCLRNYGGITEVAENEIISSALVIRYPHQVHWVISHVHNNTQVKHESDFHATEASVIGDNLCGAVMLLHFYVSSSLLIGIRSSLSGQRWHVHPTIQLMQYIRLRIKHSFYLSSTTKPTGCHDTNILLLHASKGA